MDVVTSVGILESGAWLHTPHGDNCFRPTGTHRACARQAATPFTYGHCREDGIFRTEKKGTRT